MESETAYSLLNVPRTASSDEILLAYRKESLKFHPQRFDSSDSFIHLHFKKLAEAYETLIDPQKRLEYDRQLILKKLKSKSNRKDTLNSFYSYTPPCRPGSCAPTIETTQFVQYCNPGIPVQTRGSIPTVSLQHPRPDRNTHRQSSTEAYQNQSINQRIRHRADSFSSFRPPPVLPDHRRFNPSASTPASHSHQRILHPSYPSPIPSLDQYQPLTSTLPTPKPRLASNSISSAYHYPQYSRPRSQYR